MDRCSQHECSAWNEGSLENAPLVKDQKLHGFPFALSISQQTPSAFLPPNSLANFFWLKGVVYSKSLYTFSRGGILLKCVPKVFTNCTLFLYSRAHPLSCASPILTGPICSLNCSLTFHMLGILLTSLLCLLFRFPEQSILF